MESYSSSAGLSRLPDIADAGDHRLPDPRDAPWLSSISSPTQTLTQAFCMAAWFETAHQPGKGKCFPMEDHIFSRWPVLRIQHYCKGFVFKAKNCLCTSLKSKSVSERSGIMEALISAQSHKFDLHRSWQNDSDFEEWHMSWYGHSKEWNSNMLEKKSLAG